MSFSAASRHPHLQPTFVETAFNSVLNPGVGKGTFGVLNGILAALLLSIGGMWLLGLGGQHIYVLLFLTVGLLASINWFSATLIDNNPTTAAVEQGDQQTADVKKSKRTSKSTREDAEKDDTADDDEPPARRTRSRSRPAGEERVAEARQTRSSKKKGTKEPEAAAVRQLQQVTNETVRPAGNKPQPRQQHYKALPVGTSLTCRLCVLYCSGRSLADSEQHSRQQEEKKARQVRNATELLAVW